MCCQVGMCVCVFCCCFRASRKAESLPLPLFLSVALCGLLAVPKSFQSKCKFHQLLTKKTDISIKANVLWLCCVDVSLLIASPVRKPANLPPLLRMDLCFLSLFSSLSLFLCFFFSSSRFPFQQHSLWLTSSLSGHFDPSVFT